MSNEEQDAIVGRLMREKSEALKRKAAFEAEIKLVTDTCLAVFRELDTLKASGVRTRLESIGKYFSPEAFSALLADKEQAQSEVVDKIRRLRELGFTD
jgi:hypothetical protein